jgi:hypothetical protein
MLGDLFEDHLMTKVHDHKRSPLEEVFRLTPEMEAELSQDEPATTPNDYAPKSKLPVPPIADDSINPSHYRKHPSGIECIEVTRHMNFNAGNAVKYIWRYLDKGDPVENLKKAQWYLDDEIRRLEGKR